MRRILLATILPAALIIHIAIRFAFATEIKSSISYDVSFNEVAVEAKAKALTPIADETVVDLFAVAN